jgi:transposase-like protein
MGGGRNPPLRRIDGDPFHPQRSLAGQETVRRGLWFFHGQKWKLKIPKTLLINHVPPSKGSFEPQLVPKGQTRVEGFDDRIISLPLCPGLSVREIQAHLQELYDVQVSPDLISRVTDALLEEVREWQSRKAVYVALALNIEGEKEVLGLWIEQTEGAKFWLKVMNELKTRGIADILIAVVDGLKGFPEAIGTVF